MTTAIEEQQVIPVLPPELNLTIYMYIKIVNKYILFKFQRNFYDH
jgi:hypothetical protein